MMTRAYVKNIERNGGTEQICGIDNLKSCGNRNFGFVHADGKGSRKVGAIELIIRIPHHNSMYGYTKEEALKIAGKILDDVDVQRVRIRPEITDAMPGCWQIYFRYFLPRIKKVIE